MRHDRHAARVAARPAPFPFLVRLLLCLPLLLVCLAFVTVAVVGVAKLPDAGRAALPDDDARAALTAVICFVLAAPAAALRPSLVWFLPLGATLAAGAAGWAMLPLPDSAWVGSLEGAVLLLPVMVLVLGAWWQRIPRELAAAAREAGAPRAWVVLHLVVEPALPGVACALAVVFMLALGLEPLLAPALGSP